MVNDAKAAHVVVIEDNDADVLLVRKALDESSLGYVMTRFEDGDEALRALCPETGEAELLPDILVMDLNFPRSEGIDLLLRIRQAPRLAQVPVMILTSSESPSDMHKTALLGADRYLLKPAQLDEFLTKVGTGIKDLLLEGRREKRQHG